MACSIGAGRVADAAGGAPGPTRFWLGQSPRAVLKLCACSRVLSSLLLLSRSRIQRRRYRRHIDEPWAVKRVARHVRRRGQPVSRGIQRPLHPVASRLRRGGAAAGAGR
jgi:hypothetical protein